MSFKALLVFALINLVGCNGGGTASGIGGGGQSEDPTPTPEEEACHESVVDAGSKAAVTGQRRGQFSDVKLNPINNREAFAYFDFAALTMKFTYWNGSEYVHELVAGFSAEPNKISMIFLSTGIPVIGWTTGNANVMLSIREASTSTANATWNTRVFAAVATAARAIKLEVSPNDMVGGIYNTNSASGRMKMLLCTTNCSKLTSYNNMSGAMDFVGNDNNNTAASITSVGFAWCKAATDVYYPAAVYGRIAPENSTIYAMCPSATTSSCLTGAGWTVNTQLLAAAPTANISSSLHLDSSVTNDPAKILTLKLGIGVKSYLSGDAATPVGCADIISGTAWDESAETLGGANTGNAWMQLMRTSNGKLHAVMNEGTTNIRYYNTDVGSLSAWDTFWNIGNGYLNTVTTSGHGGAVLDSTNDIIYSSYFVNLAINRFNFLLNKITSLPTDSLNVVSTNVAVNNDGHLALVTNVNRNFIIARTTSGELGTAYVDYSAGTNSTGVLKYAYRNGREISSSWNVLTIPGVTSPSSPYLSYDHLHRPWISYYDLSNARFFLLMNSSTDGTGAWTSYMMPPEGTPALPALPATNDTAIAMVQAGTAKKPVLIVLDNTAASRTVRAALLDSSTGSWSSVVSVYSIGATGASGLNADTDDDGNIVVSFLDRTAGAFLKYTNGTIVAGAPSFSTPIAIGNVTAAGQGTTVKINPVTGYPFVIFQDRANNRLFRASCENNVANCVTGVWNLEILDLFTGISGLTIATTFNENLASSAVAMRDTGAYDIFYTHGMGAQGDLRRIKVDDNGDAGPSIAWIKGRGADLVPTINFGVQGFHADAIVTPDNQLVSIFLGRGNLLVQRTCDLDQLD